MNERLAKIVSGISSFDELHQLEENARARNALDSDLSHLLATRATELGMLLLAEKTGISLQELSPVEERLARAVGEYAAIQRRSKKQPTRTYRQIKRLGLMGAAEASVSNRKARRGFSALSEDGKSTLSFEQIVVDHPSEFSASAVWFARNTLSLPNDASSPPKRRDRRTKEGETSPPRAESRQRNPDWTREELILALDLYLRFHDDLPNAKSEAVTSLSRLLHGLADTENRRGNASFRNPSGVYMKLMNFRRLDDRYSGGLSRGAEGEVAVWAEFARAPEHLARTAMEIRDRIQNAIAESNYWVFVCNPKKWDIEKFLKAGIERDTRGVRPSDRHRFAPGQLAVVRVGVDRRSLAEREGRDALQSGIYALCEVESHAFESTGAAEHFWADGEGRDAGWPTVRIRYCKTYLEKPLSIETLRERLPDMSRLMLDGHQAASFPISAIDFHAIARLLGEDLDALPISSELRQPTDGKQIGDLEARYLNASPEVKERVSKSIERGPIGEVAKEMTGRECQICRSLGRDPIAFLKRGGVPYVEAHHVMPVSERRVGSLSITNIMIVCANHHRQLHYGEATVTITDSDFEIEIDGSRVSVARLKLPRAAN